MESLLTTLLGEAQNMDTEDLFTINAGEFIEATSQAFTEGFKEGQRT